MLNIAVIGCGIVGPAAAVPADTLMLKKFTD